LRANWKPIESPIIGAKAYQWGYVRVLVERRDNNYGWHLSISRPDHYPSWDEIKTARYDLLPPNITMALIFPPPDEYVNVHPNCFHLHQIPNESENHGTRRTPARSIDLAGSRARSDG
jgi:hypothetical protein